MTDTPEVAALRRAAKKFKKAGEARDAAAGELADAIRAADESGVSRNEIQRVAGVARATVYRAVEGAK